MPSVIETGLQKSLTQAEFESKYKASFFEIVAGKVGMTEVPLNLPAKPASTLSFVAAQSMFGSGGVINPGLFTWDPATKLMMCNRDIYAITVEMTIRAIWGQNITIGAGVAVGNPLSLPTDQGVTQNGSYVSRFADVQTGRGAGRPNTFKLNYSLVGKASADPNEIGVFSGDKIFPVFWNYESSVQTVNVIDIIMTVKNTIV
ncbi:hypothetical protein phiA829_97 [Aeromonas phage phiA8-29]|uniref:Uncharacterized protein n=1 Tax=Aeromonas phage phiA8-29 TaxID=1978922 RepID=A0A1W6DY28_9CAUD|nr:hypothetical protein HWB15_gp180 [Aeromonas phage phiA8-29]ARK07917.1 hypothetical protein phiA829_97 [Aeromonas phage phiA8-29]